MLRTKTFKPSDGAKIHVLHETSTEACFGFLVALCGKQFPRKTEPGTSKATCPRCLKLDNPFELGQAQVSRLWNLHKGNHTASVDDLVRRDLVNPRTGGLTERGHALVVDVEEHPPWPGIDGVVHARNAIARKRGACGADLMGIGDMSYAKLSQMFALAEETRVTCMECILDS